MQIDYEKLIRAEVSRRVTADHPFFEDLCQEARIAILSIEDKVDRTLPLAKQKAYVRRCIRWHVTKVWQIWLRESLFVSVKSLRENRADLSKVDRGEVFLKDLASPGLSPDELVEKVLLLEKVLFAVENSILSEKERESVEGFIEEVDSRTLGKRLQMSHQGVINLQKRVLSRAKKLLKDKKVDE